MDRRMRRRRRIRRKRRLAPAGLFMENSQGSGNTNNFR
jgi:hypothetical protein